MNQALIGDRARAIGLRTLKRAAGAVTRLVPISTPVLLVGPDSAARLGRAVADFGHRRVLLVSDAVITQLGLAKPLTEALSAAGVHVVVFDGSMGATLEEFDLTTEDYGGLAGKCHEALVLNRPDVIQKLHESMVAAGAEVVETELMPESRVLGGRGLVAEDGDDGISGRQAQRQVQHEARSEDRDERDDYPPCEVGAPCARPPHRGRVRAHTNTLREPAWLTCWIPRTRGWGC